MSSDKNKFYFVDKDNEVEIKKLTEQNLEQDTKKENINLPEEHSLLESCVVSNINKEDYVKTAKKQKSKTKHYIDYNVRLIISIVVLILLLVLTIIFTANIFTISKENSYNYSENSNIDYKVYLKDNVFYEDEYLNKDMLYVASLIDKINIKFNYNFIAEEKTEMDFKYNIYAKLVITDFNDKNVYYEKEYNLLPEQNVSLNGVNKTISETLDINYDYYNKIANNFKNSYALSTKSKLIVYFNIDKSSKNSNSLFIDKNSSNDMYLEIPLSEKSVNIELNSNDINNSNKIILNKNSGISFNKIYIFLAIVSLILFIIVLLKAVKLISYLFRSKDVYDSYIEKILNEYDRMIVKTSTSPIKKENLIKVDSFEELLDVRDNIKEPIMYYVVTEHVKSQFYIAKEDKIYLTTVKKVDLEDENEKK